MQNLPTLRIIGMVLLLWAYGMNVHGVIGAWREARQSPEAAAREHLHDMAEHAGQPGSGAMSQASGPAAGPASTTAIVLTGVLLVAGVLLALFPIRQGAWYGVWGTLVVWIAIAGPRILNDPRCWQVLDPNQHGCHTFMLSVLIGVAGMVCCAVAGRNLSPQMNADGRG
ncbi:MAG: hypothetical protein M3P27_00100 [Acidobacteriota bacterium]|nr:hypothetical protein [Acidobacteriota bacterium]